ncbi:MAG: DUF6731 family protein [Paracoccaceae bacterium]
MVDRNIRILFWQPNPIDENDLAFGDSIDLISSQPDLINYTECNGGLHIRVERVSFQEGVCEGDFVRQQVDNIPPIAQEALPLQANPNPIGHRAAFRYSIDQNVLAIQSARPGVSVSAVNSYVRRRIRGHKGFFMDPCLTQDALARIREGSPRKVEMRVARPTDLAQVDPNLNGLEDSLANLQEFVDGQIVNISVGFDRSEREALLNRRRLLQLVGWADDNRVQVQKMRIKIEEESEPIDMLAERLDARGKIELDPDDLDAAYESRIQFVRDACEAHGEVIAALYG